MSSLVGAHDALFPRIMEFLKKRVDNIDVWGGGIIPQEDILKLKFCGIKEIFLPGSKVEDTVEWVKKNVKPKYEKE